MGSRVALTAAALVAAAIGLYSLGVVYDFIHARRAGVALGFVVVIGAVLLLSRSRPLLGLGALAGLIVAGYFFALFAACYWGNSCL